MTEVLQHPYVQALSRALLHFVWQGAAIGLAGYAILRRGGLSARARHAAGVALLGLMLAAPIGTTWYLAAGPVRQAAAAQVPVAVASSGTAAADQPGISLSPVAVPDAPRGIFSAVVLVLWFAGVMALSTRLAGGWIVARRLARRAVTLAAPDVQSLARRVAGRLALDRVVRVVESSTVMVPVMIGWIKPVVILPTAALAGLTPEQVEALLAHELAHVFRHDYLVNLLQTAVETVLFYHPAVWWVSRQVRAAREECCDDLAVGVCDRLVYATALAELAAMTAPPRLALAASDGSLVERVRRILGRPAAGREMQTGWMPAVLLVALVAGIAPVIATAAVRGQTPYVSGGVSRGVGSGVPGGGSQGVPAGVTGRVAGGVPDGVPGGVQASPASVPGAPSSDATTVIAPDPQTEKAKPVPEPQSAGDQVVLATLQAQLGDAQRQMDKLKAERDGGLANADQVEQIQARLKALQAKLQAAQSESSPGSRAKLALQARELDIRAAEKALERAKSRVAEGLAGQDELNSAKLALERRQMEFESSVAASQAGAAKVFSDEALRKLDLESAQLQLERTAKLFDQGMVSSDEVAKAKLDVARSEARAEIKPDTSLQSASLGPEAAAIRDRVIRETSMTDAALISALRDAANLSSDTDRAEVLLAVARQQTLTPEMVSLYVAAADGIRSDEQRARVFKQPIRLRQGRAK